MRSHRRGWSRGVSVDRIGERIIVEPVFRSRDSSPVYFGSEVDGAFAEYTVVPSRHAVRVSSSWTDVELASTPCSYSAAENMLGRARVSFGETVVVTGASGRRWFGRGATRCAVVERG